MSGATMQELHLASSLPWEALHKAQTLLPVLNRWYMFPRLSQQGAGLGLPCGLSLASRQRESRGMSVFNLNAADFFITSNWGSPTDNRIFVNKHTGDRWEPGNLVVIGESEKVKELEVSGTTFRGEKLTELSRDLRAWNDRTRCSLRVNCEGSCFVLDYRAGDSSGIRINTVFDWSKHGVRTAKERQLEFLTSQLEDKDSTVSELRRNLEDTAKELASNKSELVEARGELGALSRRLDRVNRAAKEVEEVVEEMEKEKRDYAAELRSRYEKGLERRKRRVEELEAEVEGKEREARECRLKGMKAEEEAAAWRKAAERKGKMVEECERVVEEKEKEVGVWKLRLREVEERKVSEERDVEVEHWKMKLRYKEEELAVSRKLLEWKDKVMEMTKEKVSGSDSSEIWIL
ncbi:unnamed protein product [Linum trigynum]|uniref:Uncharacterized protein n=2 Tax=Linum trigynum TaxID=586398 RepID=A0AAV2FYU2_9ROSI